LLYHQWKYTAKTDETAVIQPDGCRDLIVVSQQGARDEIRVTGWDCQPHVIHLQAGTELIGYRLRPGTTVASETFMNDDVSPAILVDMIEDVTIGSPEIYETIKALTQPGATVAQVARQNGTTTRTLQRRFRDVALPPPDFWRLLGRARRAIHALPCRVPLAEVALAYGYSDQAHMTREFVRWFGFSPSQFRKSKVLTNDICQPGLGNWLDESHLKPGSLL